MQPPPPSPTARAVLARQRGEVALAGRAGDEGAVRAALADPEPSVRAGALAALVRLGAAGAGDTAAALADPAGEVRRMACELAPRLPAARYGPLLADADPTVVEAAAFACGEVGELEALPALLEVATGHDDVLCRESAVAALGALGEPAGLPAVLAALAGPPALRRRAVVALAAFEGDEVEEALRAGLEDRDWQVRQAAADVLGLSGEERR